MGTNYQNSGEPMSEKKLSEEILKCLNDYIAVEPREMCVGVLQKAYKKIKEYEELESNERLIKLPCNIGDTLYWINSKRKCRYEESGYLVGSDIDCAFCDYDKSCREKEYFIEEVKATLTRIAAMIDPQGSVMTYLTKEQAEAALKELEGKK